MMKKNKNLIIIISVFVGTLLILGSILLIHNYTNSKAKEIYDSYVIVKDVNKDSIVVEDANTKDTKTYITDGSNFHEGDLVEIQSEGNKIKEYKVIVDGYAKMTTNPIIVIDPEETTTTTSEPNTTTITTNNTTRTTTKNNTTVKSTTVVKTTTKTTVSSKDESVLRYVETEYQSTKNSDNSATFKEKAKKTFITLVDFIFYDGEIKGVKFKELQAKTKAKVIYYTLLIDSAIDTKFPGYKDTISDKYKDIKAKLIAEFLDIKYEVCQKSTDDCAQANDDFKLLKTSLKLTWDVVKGTFIYVKNLTVPKIKSWYESFRG